MCFSFCFFRLRFPHFLVLAFVFWNIQQWPINVCVCVRVRETEYLKWIYFLLCATCFHFAIFLLFGILAFFVLLSIDSPAMFWPLYARNASFKSRAEKCIWLLFGFLFETVERGKRTPSFHGIRFEAIAGNTSWKNHGCKRSALTASFHMNRIKLVVLVKQTVMNER